MIPYHGSPMGGPKCDVPRFFIGRHAMVSFEEPRDLPVVAEVCQSFVLDNGAYTAWRSGRGVDCAGYVGWVREWCRHPGFDWALIPDVIDGNEADNDARIVAWEDAGMSVYGVPVWHLHESLDRLGEMARKWRTVALGSSGAYPHPGAGGWWKRMRAVMDVVCDEAGVPVCRLHGLRMLDPEIFSRVPFASADSANAVINAGSVYRFGQYVPPTQAQRSEVVAQRIEAWNSPAVWVRDGQVEMELAV